MTPEQVLKKLYERMWFREGLPDEGWAIDVIRAAILQEREECAKVADEYASNSVVADNYTCETIAERIRSRT